MNPQIIIPGADALPLPASALLLQFLLHLTFLLHMLAMNAMFGGLILTFIARLRSRGEDDPWTGLADSIAKVSPALVASTVTLGVAPLLFLQTLFGQFFFTSSILMGWGWFSIVVLLIFAYYGVYLQSFRGKKLGAARLPLLGVTLLLFVWTSFMLSNNMTLMLNIQQWGPKYFADARGLHLNLGDGQLWPRWLHMVVGAIATSGLMLAWWGKARLRGGAASSDHSGSFMVRVGMNSFTWYTLANIVLGLWYYMAQPGPIRKIFMGGSGFATALFGIGFAAGIVLVVMGWFGRRKGDSVGLWPLSILAVVNLVVMILMRDAIRSATLGSHFQLSGFAVQPQMFNLILFAVLLLAGIGVMIWMLRALYLVWDK